MRPSYATDANTTIGGPDIMLTSAQSQAVSMVIHELATNAAKHGALSSPNGRVSVSRNRTSADVAAILMIIWREIGGPPTVAPELAARVEEEAITIVSDEPE